MPRIPFFPLASVATSWFICYNWITEIVDQEEKNMNHHRRSFFAARDRRVRNGWEEGMRRSAEKMLRRKERPKGTTWQQCDRKPRASSSIEYVMDFALSRSVTVCKVRECLLGGKRTSILRESNSNPRWVTVVPFISFSEAAVRPILARVSL